MEDFDDDESDRKKKWYLDIKRVPCARSALIHGILVGGVSGIAFFIGTSIVRRSCDVAVGTFCIASFISWEVCRYQRAKVRAQLKNIVNELNTKKPKEDNNIIDT